MILGNLAEPQFYRVYNGPKASSVKWGKYLFYENCSEHFTCIISFNVSPQLMYVIINSLTFQMRKQVKFFPGSPAGNVEQILFTASCSAFLALKKLNIHIPGINTATHLFQLVHPLPTFIVMI